MRTVRNIGFVCLLVTILGAQDAGLLASAMDDWEDNVDTYCSELGYVNVGQQEGNAQCECEPEDSACEDYMGGQFCSDATSAVEEYCNTYPQIGIIWFDCYAPGGYAEWLCRPAD